jgi:DNA-binding LytR/AlgR family response regulator
LQNKTENGNVTGDHIFIKSNSKFFKIDFPDIIYIEGMKDYLKIHTQENILVTHQTMQEMEQLLPSKQFIRVHKSYIIAVPHIKSIYGNSIEMGKATIPIGISYKEK